MATGKKKAQLVHESHGAFASGEITRTWANSHGTYLAGRACLDEADAVAIAMERKWGCGRLRLLVPIETREKFDRQRFLLNQALWHGDLEAVRRESGRMVKAWTALDRLADAAGAKPLDRQVLEFTQADGSVVAIVPDNATASLVVADGRRVDVYTVDEIGRLLAGYPGLATVKAAFPGATVVRVNSEVEDPLEAIGDTQDPLDDPLPW
jgi:hypothetical protein